MAIRKQHRYQNSLHEIEREPDFTISWLLLTFLGIFGIHRFYQKKWLSGIIYLFTGGLFMLGVLYDFFTLNDQINELNIRQRAYR